MPVNITEMEITNAQSMRHAGQHRKMDRPYKMNILVKILAFMGKQKPFPQIEKRSWTM